MQVKGVTYDVGTDYGQSTPSRTHWATADVRRDVRAIRRDLHCTSVNFYGSDLDRLVEGASLALAEGLAVSIQPRPINSDREQMLDTLARCAREAERLRARGGVTLNTGCELTLFTSGFIPGDTFTARMEVLVRSQPPSPVFSDLLNRHLKDVARVARQEFRGPITYGSGAWEEVDWSHFDLVGVNFYRDRNNASHYVPHLRGLRRHGKPVVITEFGCCAFEGAEEMGGSGWIIVNREKDRPSVKPGYTRSEETQAREIESLLDLYEEEDLHGAYVFDFMSANHPWDPDPARDLDMAAYGIVKVLPWEPGDSSLRWKPKLAFDAVARRYAVRTPPVLEPRQDDVVSTGTRR